MSNNIGKLAGSGAKARVLPITRQNGGTRMNIVGRSEVRVDAFDKATGRTKYYDDLAPKDALLVRIKHSTIAHGFVKSVDISKAEKIPGVVKILTCFDVPDIPFPTAGHPWSMDPSHQDIADRHLLNRHVRYYGDDVCAVIAEDEVAAMQAVRAIEVEYEELPFVLDVQKAMESGAPQLHEKFPNNILKHTTAAAGNYAEAIKEPGLIKVEGWYETPTVQHCHIENHGCFCYEENGRLVVTSSTQIPHIVRRIVGQALGCGAAMESLCRIAGGAFRIEDAVSLDALIDAYSHRTYKENGRYTLEPASLEGLAAIEKLVRPIDTPLTNFGTALLDTQTARKFTDGWHIALRECEITENPRYRYREPEFEIRPEYRGAYKMYEKNPEMPDGRRFLGVAFYNHQYKKLVADKVFLRSEEL